MIFVLAFSPPFGMLEAKDEREEVVSHPYVPSTPSEELGRSRAMPSRLGKKLPPRTTFTALGKDLRVRRNILN
jgi:hypothetical protein